MTNLRFRSWLTMLDPHWPAHYPILNALAHKFVMQCAVRRLLDDRYGCNNLGAHFVRAWRIGRSSDDTEEAEVVDRVASCVLQFVCSEFAIRARTWRRGMLLLVRDPARVADVAQLFHTLIEVDEHAKSTYVPFSRVAIMASVGDTEHFESDLAFLLAQAALSDLVGTPYLDSWAAFGVACLASLPFVNFEYVEPTIPDVWEYQRAAALHEMFESGSVIVDRELRMPLAAHFVRYLYAMRLSNAACWDVVRRAVRGRDARSCDVAQELAVARGVPFDTVVGEFAQWYRELRAGSDASE